MTYADQLKKYQGLELGVAMSFGGVPRSVLTNGYCHDDRRAKIVNVFDDHALVTYWNKWDADLRSTCGIPLQSLIVVNYANVAPPVSNADNC